MKYCRYLHCVFQNNARVIKDTGLIKFLQSLKPLLAERFPKPQRYQGFCNIIQEDRRLKLSHDYLLEFAESKVGYYQKLQTWLGVKVYSVNLICLLIHLFLLFFLHSFIHSFIVSFIILSTYSCIYRIVHCLKYRTFTKFPGVEILWKRTVSAEFPKICPKFCRSSAFPQNFHTRKLGEILVIYAVVVVFLTSADKSHSGLQWSLYLLLVTTVATH